MKESYETISIVYISDENLYGTCDKIGVYASTIKYNKDGVDHEVLMDNEDFMVMDEITFVHVEEEE